MSRRGLQVIVMVLGAVALVFGSLSVFIGAAFVLDGGRVNASVDSELRFYAAWYAAAGVILLRASARVESEGTPIRAVCAVFFIGGCARLLSLIFVGTPHPVFLALMVAELAIPAFVVPWQSAVAHHA